MFELSENSLGLYHADMAPSPAVSITRDLIAAEKNMQPYMVGRNDNKVKILTLYNTSYHFSVDHPIALQGIRTHIHSLYNCLKEQSNFMLEHLFNKKYADAIGQPKLIILPGMQTLSPDSWAELLKYTNNGATLLICGCIDQNEYFATDKKIGALDSSYTIRKIRNFENLVINGQEYLLDFRKIVGYADAGNILNCGETSFGNEIAEYQIGTGKILYCPYPIEYSDNTETINACYQYAIERAEAQNDIYQVFQSRPNVILTATAYENCTVYTLINDGFEDTVIWKDLRSDRKFTVTLKANCGCKLWINKCGNLLQTFGECILDQC